MQLKLREGSRLWLDVGLRTAPVLKARATLSSLDSVTQSAVFHMVTETLNEHLECEYAEWEPP